MWCSAALASRRMVDVDLVRIGQGTLGNSVGLITRLQRHHAGPERYRHNVAIFDIAIGKAYTWPKDIQLIQRFEFIGEEDTDVRSIRLIPSGRSGGAIVPYPESSARLFANVEHGTDPRPDGCPSPS